MTTDTSSEYIASLLEDIPEGPWYAIPQHSTRFTSWILTDDRDRETQHICNVYHTPEQKTHVFIAEARSLVPLLASERDKLAARVKELESLLNI
jgi:phenylpyruvate tautomerase PptA (4-oxalocrotonate tautomerase family)